MTGPTLDALRAWLHADTDEFLNHARRAVRRGLRRLRWAPEPTLVRDLVDSTVDTLLDPWESARAADATAKSGAGLPEALNRICFRNVERHVMRLRRRRDAHRLALPCLAAAVSLVDERIDAGRAVATRLSDEQRLTLGALLESGGNQTRAAALLGISPPCFRMRLARIRQSFSEDT